MQTESNRLEIELAALLLLSFPWSGAKPLNPINSEMLLTLASTKKNLDLLRSIF